MYVFLYYIQLFRKTSSQCMWTGIAQWYSDSLQPGQSGDRIPVGGEIFRTFPDRPWGPPSLLYNGYRVFHGGKAAWARRWPPIPVWRRGWRNSKAIPLLPLWFFVVCSSVNCTFTCTYYVAACKRFGRKRSLVSVLKDFTIVDWKFFKKNVSTCIAEMTVV
jgi:hypothetical protein